MMMGSKFSCSSALLETTVAWRKVFFQMLKAHEQLSKEHEGSLDKHSTAYSSLLPAIYMGGRKESAVLQLLPQAATRQTAHQYRENTRYHLRLVIPPQQAPRVNTQMLRCLQQHQVSITALQNIP